MKTTRLFSLAALCLVVTACAESTSNLPPPRWGRVEDATVTERTFTPEAEYFLGRSVAARLANNYGLDQDEAAVRYVALTGTYIAFAGDLSVPYRGYQFAVLATDEVRAFSAPGGYVMVSRGLLKAARNEDELAGVIAHELAHLGNRDAIRSVGQSKSTSILTAVGTVVASLVGLDAMAGALLQSFEGAVDHAVTDLVVKGYSRSQEVAADIEAVRLMKVAGYDPAAYMDFVRRTLKDGAAITSTHPASEVRIAELTDLAISSNADPTAVKKRAERYAAVVKKGE